ncbi:MAG: hypothetical protein PHQ40_17235 [Anaerolineaceae bacterium]|nr:hypothetical protein [Anaerolineaceae bacterium]
MKTALVRGLISGILFIFIYSVVLSNFGIFSWDDLIGGSLGCALGTMIFNLLYSPIDL